MRHRLWAIWALALPLLVATPARAEEDEDTGFKTKLSGFISSDLRYAFPWMNPFWCSDASGGWRKGWCHGETNLRDIKPRIVRNENIARFRFTAGSNDYKGVAEIDFVWTGISRPIGNLTALSKREEIDPFRLEAHALYFDISDFITKGLDIRIGKQIVSWGRADMFNPTSNLNPLDLEDQLLFGDRISNNMVRVDYNPKGDWILSLVWVPIFRPNQVPSSASFALASIDRIPIVDGGFRRKLHVERDFAARLLNLPTVVTEAVPQMPDTTIDNSQVGFKVAGKLKKMDLSLSYYYGRSGLPTPSVDRTFGADGFIDTRSTLMYPRMHVLGFDWGGQIPVQKGEGAKGIGFWFELAVFFPQRVRMPIYQSGVPVIPDGEYDYDGDGNPGGLAPMTLDSRPFAKWTLGFDYTFNKHVFMNVQWVHGFVDEFGAGDWFHKRLIPTRGYMDLDTNNDGREDLDALMDCGVAARQTNGNLCAKETLRPRLGDYLVAGFDFKFYREQMLLRLFFILDLTGAYTEEWIQTGNQPTDGERRRTYHNAFTPKGFNLVLFPQWTWSIGHGAEIAVGGFWMFGKTTTKFGDPAAGGSMIFGKAKYSF